MALGLQRPTVDSVKSLLWIVGKVLLLQPAPICQEGTASPWENHFKVSKGKVSLRIWDEESSKEQESRSLRGAISLTIKEQYSRPDLPNTWSVSLSAEKTE